jgi:hypothetical protein
VIKFVLVFLLGILGILFITERVDASDLRIVDSAGLIRAVRVVKDSAVVKVSLVDGKGGYGECVAMNVDGIASERREKISPQGECTFAGLAAGTWQIAVSEGFRWRVKINE